MNRIILTLTLLALPATLRAQEKSITGIWDFAQDGLLMEITEKTIGKYGEEQPGEYDMDGDKLVDRETGKKIQFELRDKNTLIIVDGGEEHIATRMEINPLKDRKLPAGKYMPSEGSNGHIEILDEINLRQYIHGMPATPFKYLIHGTKLYIVQEGYYMLFEINENASFTGSGRLKDAAWQWVSGEEYAEILLNERFIKDLDGDQTGDTVYYDYGKERVVCKLSSRHFEPEQSLRIDFTMSVCDDENGFMLADYGSDDCHYSLFGYEPETGKIRLVAIIRNGNIPDGSGGSFSFSRLNLLTGEFAVQWPGNDACDTIETTIEYPAIYLEDFSAETIWQFAEKSEEPFRIQQDENRRRHWKTGEFIDETEENIIVITLPDGELEISEGRAFPCVGVRFTGRVMGSGTYFEIKRRDGRYVIRGKKYKTVNAGIADYLENDCFKSYYKDKKQRKKAWDAFVKDGGLQRVIDFVNEIIDDEFLDSPLNEIYG